MSQKRNKIAVGTFLLLGTLLSLYIAIDGIVNYSNYVTLIHRMGLFKYSIIIDFLLIFPIFGLISTWSYFTQGQLWKPLTKTIIVNIYIWLAYILCTYLRHFILDLYVCIVIIIIIFASWGLACLWKSIISLNNSLKQ